MSEQEIRLRRHYADTALARIGVAFERGMKIEAVRGVVEAAALGEIRRGIAEMKAAA